MDISSLPDRPLREAEFENLQNSDSVDVMQGMSTIGVGEGFEGMGEVFEFGLLTDDWACGVVYDDQRGKWVAGEKIDYPDDFDHDSYEDKHMFTGIVVNEVRDEHDISDPQLF